MFWDPRPPSSRVLAWRDVNLPRPPNLLRPFFKLVFFRPWLRIFLARQLLETFAVWVWRRQKWYLLQCSGITARITSSHTKRRTPYCCQMNCIYFIAWFMVLIHLIGANLHRLQNRKSDKIFLSHKQVNYGITTTDRYDMGEQLLKSCGTKSWSEQKLILMLEGTGITTFFKTEYTRRKALLFSIPRVRN